MLNFDQSNQFERQTNFNDTVTSDSQSQNPKYSPIKRKDPNKKYVPINQFVSGEGDEDEKNSVDGSLRKQASLSQYRHELER